MKIKNLTKIYIYKPISKNVLGEIETKWELKGNAYVNIQQDFNELDRNISGNIDYESIKMRTDTNLDIQNGDGISVEETSKPQYIVKNKPIIGKTVVYTCNTYNGE